MKKNLFFVISVLLGSVSLTGCLNDEKELVDKVENIELYVFHETGIYRPWGSPEPVECMLVKDANDLTCGFYPLPLGGISGFVYEKGYEYLLSVERTTLADPPADDTNRIYTLIEELSKQRVESQP